MVPEWLERLTDFMVEETLKMSDEEILAEFREDGGDPEEYANRMRSRFELALKQHKETRDAASDSESEG